MSIIKELEKEVEEKEANKKKKNYLFNFIYFYNNIII